MDKPEFRPIGHLATTIANTPASEKDGTITASTMSSKASETTTAVTVRSGPTGQKRGGNGLVSTNATVTAALREASGRDVRELLPASVMSSVAPVWAKAEHVSDDVVVGYQLIAIPLDNVLEASRAVLAQTLAPAGFEFAKQQVQLLRLGTRDGRKLADDEELAMVADYAQVMSEKPRDIIIAACYGEPRWDFWPSRGALLNRADALTRKRRQLAEALSPKAVARAKERLAAEAEQRRREAERRPPSEEDKAAVSEIVRKTVEALTGAVSKSGTKRPQYWDGSRSQRLFMKVLSTVNAAAAQLGGDARMEAWELVATAQTAGLWRAMAPDARRKLHELYRMAKSARVKPVAA